MENGYLAGVPAAMRTAPISGEGVFSCPVMARVAYVASPIPRLICMEVVEALRPALWHRSSVTVVRIKAVVNMAVKAARAMKPGTCPDEGPVLKPFRAVVPKGSACKWSRIEIPVRTIRSGSDIAGLRAHHGNI